MIPRSAPQKKETHHPTIGFPPAGIAVSPDGARVFIAEANHETNLNNALTLAYDAVGNKLWTARFRGCEEYKCSSRPWYYNPIAVSHDGSRVFVTSLSVNRTVETGFVTVSYDSATGQEQWATRYEANVGDCFCGPSVSVNPISGEVYISGTAHIATPTSPGTTDIATIAYDPVTGAQRWAAIHRNPSGDCGAVAIAVSPRGDRVFSAGATRDALTLNADLLALAYETGVPPVVRPFSVHSRKTHGPAGVFDLYLPIAGKVGIECRGSQIAGAHEIVFKFATAVSYASVSVVPATNKSAELDGPPVSSGDEKEIVLKLRNVSDAQTVGLQILGLSDGTQSNDVNVPISLLRGDSNADRRVNISDTTETKSAAGAATAHDNFRADVNRDGRINVSDTNFVKAHAGSALPP